MRIALVACSAAAFFALAGCGPGPAAPQAAWVAHIDSSDPSCRKSGATTQFGEVTTSKIPTWVDDGANGARVTCSVAGPDKGPFSVLALASEGANSLEIIIDSISPDASESSPAKGSVIYSSTVTAVSYQSPGATCNFYFYPDLMNSPNPSVAPGQIWVAFDCPEIQNGESASTCSLPAAPSNHAGANIAVFENCSTIAM